MAESFKIDSSRTLDNALEWVRALHNKHGYLKLSAVVGKRSLDKNALSHVWYAEISRFKQDETPIQCRCFCKLHFGVPILRAENPAFAEHYNKFVLHQATYEEKLEFMMFCDVTSIMTQPQMTDYLNQVQQYWQGEGLFLESKGGE